MKGIMIFYNTNSNTDQVVVWNTILLNLFGKIICKSQITAKKLENKNV